MNKMLLQCTVSLREALRLPELKPVKASADPLENWCGNIFVYKRKTYYFISNIHSWFSVMFYHKRNSDLTFFQETFFNSLELYCEYSQLSSFYDSHLQSVTAQTMYTKLINKSNIASLNNRITLACSVLDNITDNPIDTAAHINKIPVNSKNYATPIELMRECAK